MAASYLLSELAQYLNAEFEGADRRIEGMHSLKSATPSHLSFADMHVRHEDLAATKAAAVLLSSKHQDLLPDATEALIVDNPRLMMAYATKLFWHCPSADTFEPVSIGEGCSIASTVCFGENVTIGERVTILAGCYIGDESVIGSDTIIYPNVSIYHQTLVGSECLIHSGTTIGSDGYSYEHTKEGEHVKVYQNGNVVIEDQVEIGANCTIDRAVFGSTYIRRGTKLDNLIQIAHNCDVGKHSLFAAQVGLAGSTTTGRNIVMGGHSSAAGHLHIGDFSTIAGKAGVTKTLSGGRAYAGFPAIEHKLWLRMQAKLASLVKKKK